MNSELVSIILPVFNGEKYLAQSIESVLAQTYKNIELIVVNDNSSDNSLSIMEEFAKRDDRVKVVSNGVNLKLPKSLNAGFALANGKYLTWTSDDNFYSPEAIELMVEYLQKHPNDAMVCANFTKINETNSQSEKISLEVSPQNMMKGNCVGACFLYRKEIADKVGEYKAEKFLVEDYDFWLRVMLEGNIGHIERDLYTYRVHNSSLTGQRIQEIMEKTEEIIKEYLPLYKKRFKNLKFDNKEHKFMKKIFSKTKTPEKKVYTILGIKITLKRKQRKNEANYDVKLTANEWGNLYNISMLDDLCNSVNKNVLTVQTKEILKLSQKGLKTLEIGSGTGQSSLFLSKNGCDATVLDYQQNCLDLTKQAAKRLNLDIKTALCDAFKENPYKEKEFDIIFHSGLLEHFSQEERILFLKLWRKSCKLMVSMVPNAASIAYRTGKEIMEKNGTWQYGLEMPLYTQIPDFTAAGYKIKAEYTIGAEHALNFLDCNNPLYGAIKSWLHENVTDDDCHQGYLLVTIGENE